MKRPRPSVERARYVPSRLGNELRSVPLTRFVRAVRVQPVALI
jgi:hypothetical protein